MLVRRLATMGELTYRGESIISSRHEFWWGVRYTLALPSNQEPRLVDGIMIFKFRAKWLDRDMVLKIGSDLESIEGQLGLQICNESDSESESVMN